MYYLRLNLTTQHKVRDCCALIFPETWLNSAIPNSTIIVDRLTTFHADWSHALRIVVCAFTLTINGTLALKLAQAIVLQTFLMLKYQPFYPPREFTAISIMAVYIPLPTATTNDALSTVYQSVWCTILMWIVLLLLETLIRPTSGQSYLVIIEMWTLQLGEKNTRPGLHKHETGIQGSLLPTYLGNSAHLLVMLIQHTGPYSLKANHLWSRL